MLDYYTHTAELFRLYGATMATPSFPFGPADGGAYRNSGLLTPSGWKTLNGYKISVNPLGEVPQLFEQDGALTSDEYDRRATQRWAPYNLEASAIIYREMEYAIAIESQKFFFEKISNFYRMFALRAAWEERVIEEKNILEGLIK